DISVGADGTAWMIGTILGGGGYDINRWNGTSWVQIPGGAMRIAVDNQGQAWVINSVGLIYHWENGGFVPKPGLATDIGAGADGSVWIIGIDSQGGGYGIWQLSGQSWVRVPGGAVRIAVGANGDPWVINSGRGIYHWVNGGFVYMPGAADD